ncbi:MAG: DUF3872 domain-containing protein [Bacteroidales bacterium]|jgi:hypothetical protein|nr:DUF3872 domain-containing protein [Bacteroidales bacterium]
MKKQVKGLSAILLALLGTVSCNIDVEDYALTESGFAVSVEDYPSRIKTGETIGIRCRIIPDEHQRYIHYFYMYRQREGNGILENTKGNKLYEYTTNFFKGESFTVYYTAQSGTKQELVLSVHNNYGKKENIIIKFND